MSERSFAALLADLGLGRLGFDDFRRNGLLLPGNEDATIFTGLPLHRGPHRTYNRMVIERVGQIERHWSAQRLRRPEQAREHAFLRFDLLQRALRRRLLDPIGRRFSLNRRDPFGRSIDFSELDAMAELLWSATQQVGQ